MFSKGNWMTQYHKTEKGTYVKRQKAKNRVKNYIISNKNEFFFVILRNCLIAAQNLPYTESF